MFTRRFLLLVGILVTLNVALWLTPAGLAIRQAALPQLFGKSLIRADVVDRTGEWRIDRGVILSISPLQVTLKEADGHLQQIGISSATRVVAPSGRALPGALLAKGWRVLVTWPATGTADTINVEKRGRLGGGHVRARN